MHHARGALDQAQLRVHAWRLAVDPATSAWVAEARASVGDGSAARDSVGVDELRAMIGSIRQPRG